MVGQERTRREKKLREDFNELINDIFKRAEEIYSKGRRSSLTLESDRFDEKLEEFERLALQQREKMQGRKERPTEREKLKEATPTFLSYEQMRKWVRKNLELANLADFKPNESAIEAAMALYALFEGSKTPRDLGEGLEKWVGA